MERSKLFLTYQQADSWQPKRKLVLENTGSSKLDRWIVSRLQSLVAVVHQEMKAYRLYLVVPAVLSFIDDLTNWYIRCNRRRFWGSSQESQEKQSQEEAFMTLAYVLFDFSKLLAAFAPFISEKIYQNLLEGLGLQKESVHLSSLPKVSENFIDKELEAAVSLIRKTVTLGRSLRQKHSLKIRQVLQSMTVVTRNEADKSVISEFMPLLKAELNVRDIFFSAKESDYVELSFRPDLKKLGRRLGKDVKKLQAELRELNKTPEKLALLLDELEAQKSITLAGHSFELADFLVDRKAKEGLLVATAKGVTVLLNTELSDDLKKEGLAEELL